MLNDSGICPHPDLQDATFFVVVETEEDEAAEFVVSLERDEAPTGMCGLVYRVG